MFDDYAERVENSVIREAIQNINPEDFEPEGMKEVLAGRYWRSDFRAAKAERNTHHVTEQVMWRLERAIDHQYCKGWPKSETISTIVDDDGRWRVISDEEADKMNAEYRDDRDRYQSRALWLRWLKSFRRKARVTDPFDRISRISVVKIRIKLPAGRCANNDIVLHVRVQDRVIMHADDLSVFTKSELRQLLRGKYRREALESLNEEIARLLA